MKRAESGSDPEVNGTEPDPDPQVSGLDPHIRIQTKMSRIHNTAWNLATSIITIREKKGMSI
jgi:hypothetical protein